MMSQQRLSEEFLDDNSASSVAATEGLLFARLAPLLVLRLIPRQIFGDNCAQALLCGLEDLDHLEKYVHLQQHGSKERSESSLRDEMATSAKQLFHVLARSVVDPLEFKEVKMLATESLAKFPPQLVLPFVLAHLLAFLREMMPLANGEEQKRTTLIVTKGTIPASCGLVTAKLMVYYLNRVFAEDMNAFKDTGVTAPAIVMLLQILKIPCAQGSESKAEESLLIDLQRGCIDGIAEIMLRLAEGGLVQDGNKVLRARASSLMNLVLNWIFCDPTPGIDDDKGTDKQCHGEEDLVTCMQHLLESESGDTWSSKLPMQIRICCCNVILSAISRSENSVLLRWKSDGVISRVILATEHCSEDDVVAGALQIIFSFLYKSSDMLSMEDSCDRQLVRSCFDTTVARLEFTRNEKVAMGSLKVVGVLVGKLPSFVSMLSQADLARLIDRSLVSLRDRQVSSAVSELAQSLLQAITPP
ncbi:hypothetical protein PHYBOEH_005690 [Phytophthora boehmeriae]|uniref:Uncharacterized protein n=1 Tax=Phytophthora boehmeriae TaxID=109152 RepID=A0A8T1X7K0_9STRA|nr:hypothetical protein PHYBOEH_005690 [Phytophthora boehmeriae]